MKIKKEMTLTLFNHLGKFIYSLIVLGTISNVCSTPPEADSPWKYIPTDIKKVCDSVEHMSVPSQDMPPEALQKELKGCDTVSLYYGYECAPDYVKARQCALSNHSDWGNLVLAMIYANGKGVQRNLDLALHFVCADNGGGAAPAELQGRVEHLQKLKAEKSPDKDFDMCDDITSGYMMGFCSGIESTLKDKKMKKDLADLTAKWTPEQHKAYQQLQEANKAYIEARIGNEVDISGTARGALVIGEQSTLEETIFKRLQASETCTIPSATGDQFQKVDQELNTLYKEVISKEFFPSSGISPEGIKKTQRAWIKYRDAWVSFGHIKCPDISAESWKTLLTEERINQLKELKDMGS
jgi:uncharacterized protein YecT (DUF1311 family)